MAMQFKVSEDYNLLQALINEGVITLSDYEAWVLPEEGDLIPAAMENAHKVDEKKWISALIKILQIHRINNPQVDPLIHDTLELNLENVLYLLTSCYVYPLCITQGNLWVGVVRLDTKKEKVEELFPDFEGYSFCAISPREAKDIENYFRKYIKQELKTMQLETEIAEKRR